MPNHSSKIKVLSLNNPHVIRQVKEVIDSFYDLDYELIPIIIQEEIQIYDSGFMPIGQEGLFDALLAGIADVACLEATALPYPLPIGLEVIALLGSGESKELILNPDFVSLEHLDDEKGPLEGMVALLALKERPELKSVFESKDIRCKFGQVTLVGFGPGNADLLTVGGDKALEKADIIFHDDLLDQNFPERYRAEKFYVGKRKDCHSYRQDRINRLLFNAARAGKRVVRLKGGDPMGYLEYLPVLQWLLIRKSL